MSISIYLSIFTKPKARLFISFMTQFSTIQSSFFFNLIFFHIKILIKTRKKCSKIKKNNRWSEKEVRNLNIKKKKILKGKKVISKWNSKQGKTKIKKFFF